MAITSSQANLPALDSHQRNETGNELQATLLELLDLSLLGKQLHWSIVGPQFRSMHLYLDELVDSWRELSDTVAERAVAIGAWPDGQARTIAADSPLKGVERGPLGDRVVIRELVHRIAEVTERVRERIERLSELDAASEDVLVETLRSLEEQQWMLRVQLDPAD